MHPPRSRAAVLLAVLLAVMAASACASDDAAPDDAPAGPVAVVLAPHSTELAPTLSATDTRRLDALVDGPHDARAAPATAYVVTDGEDVASVDLEPRRPNGAVEHGPRRAALVDDRVAALARAVDAAPAGGAPDLLRALGNAARTDARTVLVLSAGVVVTDGWDMRVTGWDTAPGEVVAHLREHHLLPDLTDRLVVLDGLGRTAGAQPALGVREQAALRTTWLAVCGATGARCEIDDGVRPARPALTTRPGPVVDVPRIASVSGPTGRAEVSVPSDLLFRPDRCDLVDPDAAAALLRDVVDRLRAGTAAVSMSGRTAPVGPGDGVALSTCRAQAVAGLLLARGAPPDAVLDVRGDGAAADPPQASHDERGRLDPARLPALRRVVLTLDRKDTR